jgi:curved DNA-binding protein CbpA
MNEMSVRNYYEVLQLSPNAAQLVITKVYRLLAAYYHPDNKQTGDEEKFKQVLKAYEVLSDPARRSKYNLEYLGQSADHGNTSVPTDKKPSWFQTRDGLKGKLANFENGNSNPESNGSERGLRQLMLLALYDNRRSNPRNPEISLLVLSELLGCPIEGLEFSNWYLREKGLIQISESADFSITIDGVDYVEKELLRPESEKPLLSLPDGRR